MKRLIKQWIGRSAISAAQYLPLSRRLLRPLAIRTSHGLFGSRMISIPMGAQTSLLLTHVDESYLSFQLFWQGTDFYEPLTRALLRQLLKPGDIFIDIGAHIGFFSLTAALSIQNLAAIAFEPNPKNFRSLQANAKANGLVSMICESLAISDSTGSATLYLTESDMSASLMKGFQAEDTQQIGAVEVQTSTLDSYLRKERRPGGMVIKVDIEGHETAFFRGAVDTIATHKPDIILEVLNDQPAETIGWLKSLGYRFYPITDSGLVELEYPKLIKRFPFLFLNHLLSIRPTHEVATIFERVKAATHKINLRNTSKHFPAKEWPALWREEKCADHRGK